jgi:hypothetical protein
VSVRRLVGSLLVVGALATVAGALFDLVHGGTTLTRSIAYAFWFAAALAFLLRLVLGSKRLARRFDLPLVEGWVFTASAVALTTVGVLVDLVGS